MEHCGKKMGSNSVHLKEMVSQLLHPCCRTAQAIQKNTVEGGAPRGEEVHKSPH